ncbi:hypothetical protein Lal_00029838 [Lupinus albus]|nr:hypothetical protein Lal_00029838 [Lupinus albus]
MLEQPEEKKFKKKGLKFKDNLTSIFALSTTTGEYAWASSPGVLPKNVQNSDSYEGSGDSEDATIGASTEGGDPSVGCTNEFKFFKFNNSEVQSRTRGFINDINEKLSDPYSIANVLCDVKVSDMEPGSKLLAQSNHVLRNVELRKLYVAQGDENSKLNFLLYEIDTLRATTVVLVVDHSLKYMCKEPCRTSALTGHGWVQELLYGHDIHCYEKFRIEKHVFTKDF